MSNGNDARPCPVCGQSIGRQFWEKGAIRLVQCNGCSMVYADPVPESMASGRFYEHRPYYLSPEKLESDYAPVRFERELRLLRAWCSAGEVLDVGCSTGGFLHQLRSRFPGAYDVLGTDVPGEALDYAASRGLPVSRKGFLDLDVSERRFDAITFWAVLEHLEHPKRFLEKAAQLLKPGGHCFILVPNLRSLAVRSLGLKYRYIMAEHLSYFTTDTLRAFTSGPGVFETVEYGSSHFNPLVIWQDFWSAGTGGPDEDRARLLKRTTSWKQHPAVKPIKWLYQGVERVIGSMGLADNLFVVMRRKK